MKRKRRKLNIKASEAAKPAQPGPGQPDSYILHLRRPMPVARAIRWSPLLQESGRSGTSAADDESAGDAETATDEQVVAQAAAVFAEKPALHVVSGGSGPDEEAAKAGS